MKRNLTIRRNNDLVSLFLDINAFSGEHEKYSDIIRGAINYAYQNDIDWKQLTFSYKTINEEKLVNFPDVMQFTVNNNKYEAVYEDILNKLKPKRLKNSYAIKLILISYKNFLSKGNIYDESNKFCESFILAQCKYWLEDELNAVPNNRDYNAKDIRRALCDRDCKLTGGNLYADTIISLWFPLKFFLIQNDKYKLIFGDKNKLSVSRAILDSPELYLYFEDENKKLLFEKLEKLFKLGQTRANVMILPQRILNRFRGYEFYDYMPAFLFWCFNDGVVKNRNEDNEYLWEHDNKTEKIKKFNNVGTLKEWIKNQHLEFFFNDDKLCKNKIIDIHGTGNLLRNLPLNKSNNLDSSIIDLNAIYDFYIDFLEDRSKWLQENFYIDMNI